MTPEAALADVCRRFCSTECSDHDDACTALREAIERLTGERDKAREECGHEKAMRWHLHGELTRWIDLKRAADENAARNCPSCRSEAIARPDEEDQ